MPLLDVVQDVCDEVGLPRPSAVAASTDQLARQMHALANAALRSISKDFEWPVLTREHTFATVNGQETYNPPANFRRLIAHTLYNRDLFYQMKGSVSGQEWQHTKALNLGSMSRSKVRLYGSPLLIHIVPTPSAAEDVVFEYTTKNFAKDNVGVEKLAYQVDTDESLISEDLIRLDLKWRIKHAKGLEFSADLSEAQAAHKAEYSRALALPAIVVGGNYFGEYPELTQGYTPENGYGV